MVITETEGQEYGEFPISYTLGTIIMARFPSPQRNKQSPAAQSFFSFLTGEPKYQTSDVDVDRDETVRK